MQMDENIIEVLDVAEIPDNNQSEKEEPEIKVNLFDNKHLSLEVLEFLDGRPSELEISNQGCV